MHVTAVVYKDGSTVLTFFKSEDDMAIIQLTPSQLLQANATVAEAVSKQFNAAPDSDQRVSVYKGNDKYATTVYPSNV